MTPQLGQGNNARKVNCSCLHIETSFLLAEFVNKNSFLWPEYFIDFLCERWIPCQASTSFLCLHYRPETVHSSTKDAYTSEITNFEYIFFWEYQLKGGQIFFEKNPYKNQFIIRTNPYNQYIFWEKIHTIHTFNRNSVQSIHLKKKSVHWRKTPFLKNSHKNSTFLLQFFIHCPLRSCVRVKLLQQEQSLHHY